MNDTISFIVTGIMTIIGVQATKTLKIELTDDIRKIVYPILSALLASVIHMLFALGTGQLSGDSAVILTYIAQGFAAGLSASGFYDITKGVSRKIQKYDRPGEQ